MIKTTPTDAKRSAIDAFIDAGYCLIPLRGKRPINNSWPETVPGTYGPNELMTVNYGVALRAGDLILDVDPRHFKEGDKPLARLLKDIGVDLSATFVVQTGGGGVHVYLRKSPDFVVANDMGDAYAGIEIKSMGRQVVGPGSIHPDSGKRYQILTGAPSLVLDAPEALLKLCAPRETPNTNFSDAKGLDKYQDDKATQDRYIKYLVGDAEPSVDGRSGGLNAVKVAMRGRDLALPPEMTYELMIEHWNPRCEPPWADLLDLRTKVINAYRYAKSPLGASHPSVDYTAVIANPKIVKDDNELSWLQNKNGTPTKSFHNLMNYLRSPSYGLQTLVGFNEFTGRYEFLKPAPWHRGRMPRNSAINDHDLKLLKGYFVTRCAHEATISTIEEAVANVAHDHRFHPIREYLDGLIWDGKPRLNTWLQDFVGVEDSPYTRACARKTICAAVMRVVKPGIKFDHVLVLEGEQDVGKSGVIKILGGEWAADFTIDPHNKDTIQLLQGKWIVEIAELDVLSSRRTETDALKAFLTRDTDTARLAYGRLTSEFPRQFVFIATKNPGADGTYLKDETGNRRWWPVECRPKGGQVDFRGLKAARNQIFAEAVHVMKQKGEALFMETKALKEAAKDVVETRRAAPEWLEIISKWLWRQSPENRKFVTKLQVYTMAIGMPEASCGRREEHKIAQAMRALSYKNTTSRVDGHTVRGYKLQVELEDETPPQDDGIFEGF